MAKTLTGARNRYLDTISTRLALGCAGLDIDITRQWACLGCVPEGNITRIVSNFAEALRPGEAGAAGSWRGLACERGGGRRKGRLPGHAPAKQSDTRHNHRPPCFLRTPHPLPPRPTARRSQLPPPSSRPRRTSCTLASTTTSSSSSSLVTPVSARWVAVVLATPILSPRSSPGWRTDAVLPSILPRSPACFFVSPTTPTPRVISAPLASTSRLGPSSSKARL